MSELCAAIEVGDLAKVESILASFEDGAVSPEEMSDAGFRLALDSGFKKIAWVLLSDGRFNANVGLR